MLYKRFITLLILALPLRCLGQKAYDAVYYQAQLHSKAVKFTLANGYIAGCVITLTTSPKTKRVLFLPESGTAGHTLKFLPEATKRSDYFMIKNLQENYADAPRVINATYTWGTTTEKIIFRKTG